ncbi:MAG: nitroreductase family protein [Prevotella sp.]|jgi:nitroreductase
MKNTRIIFTLLLALLTVGGVKAQSVDTAEVVLKNIMTRSSIRTFQQRPVEKEKIEKLLRAGMAAPTSMDRRPWHFVVLSEKEDIERYAASNEHHADKIRKTPLFIIVCGDTTKMQEGAGRDFWIQDNSCASENILLAAHAMGLGAVWTSAYPIQKKVDGIRKALHLSERFIPLNVICIGYPAEPADIKDKWNPDDITYGIKE